MWNPKTAGIDEIHLEAENLNTILEIVISNNELNTNQKNSLLGMALNASANLLYCVKQRKSDVNNLINTYRHRILKSALLRHQRKTGSTCLIINMPKGGINTIELTEILIDGLLRRFEKMILSEYGNIEGVKAIRGIYSNAVDVNGSGEFLTESGKALIDELIFELVEFCQEKISHSGDKP